MTGVSGGGGGGGGGLREEGGRLLSLCLNVPQVFKSSEERCDKS